MFRFSHHNFLERSALRRSALPLVITAFGAALLAGCGGGGGNGNPDPGGNTGNIGTNNGTNNGNNSGGGIGNAAVVGKVVTVTGDPVPGATVIPDTGGLIATSISQGGYRLDGLTGDVVHRITAAVTVNGINYTGSTQVLTLSGNLISNANILVSQQGQQATLTGRVTDSTRLDSGGNPTPIFQARVFLVVPNSTNYSSLIAFTDSNGVYTIPNVPVNLPTVAPIQVAVSLERYSNQSFPIKISGPGTFGQDFSLTPSTNQSINTPNLQAVTASTQPSSVFTSSTGNLRPRTARSGSVYEQIRRLISPAYAKSVTGHQANATRRLTAHLSGGFGSYAIETDIAFDNPSQSGSLFAYTVYRTAGNTPPQQIGSQIYDVLQDPLANVYTDIDPSYQPYTQYNFALSATNTDRTETPLSNTLSVVPLGQLALTQPQTGQILANNITLNWSLVSGATKYYIFLYSGDQFPTINATPVFALNTPLAGNVGTFTLPSALLGSRDYYAVVVGASDQIEGNDSTGAKVTIPNAVTTFSQITKFHVQ